MLLIKGKVIGEGKHDDLLKNQNFIKIFMKNKLKKYNVVFI